MTGASYLAAYVEYAGSGDVPPEASTARSVIRIRVIGQWLVWLGSWLYV